MSSQGERRRRPGGSRQRSAVFDDGVERMSCGGFQVAPPPKFPVHTRAGVATLRPLIVARREGAILLCDGAHEGTHTWPDGTSIDNG